MARIRKGVWVASEEIWVDREEIVLWGHCTFSSHQSGGEVYQKALLLQSYIFFALTTKGVL